MMRSLLLATVLLSAEAFAPSTLSAWRRTAPLQAEGGAPQYDKFDGLLTSEKVAEGSYLLHITATDETTKLDYQPGHVLALELEDKSGDLNEDAKKNGGWMRGPYTVSRCTERSLDVLVRVVGKKSKDFSEAPSGTPVRFGGKFKVPILKGVDKEEAQKVVLVSTGVGVGPCVGAIELALQNESFPPIALFASYKESSDVAFAELLDELAAQHPTKLEWKPIVTSEVGRLSSSEENLQMVSEATQGLGIADTHYHLIGNGQMVNEWKQGLEKAGVPEARVTVEQYFSHKAEADETAIETIASAIVAGAAVQA